MAGRGESLKGGSQEGVRGGSVKERGGAMEIWVGDGKTWVAEERGGCFENGGGRGDQANGVWRAAQIGTDDAGEWPYVDLGVKSLVLVLSHIDRDELLDAYSKFSLITRWTSKLVFRKRSD